MKKIINLTFALLIIIGSCDKDKDAGALKPSGFSASKGVAVGTVFIDFELTGGSESVEVFRREKGGSEYDWQMIIGTGAPFFDFAGYWGGTGMPQGKVFEYKLRSCCGEANEFTEIDEGYAYVIIPVTSIEITSSQTSNLLRWNEGNNESFLNEVEIRFDVYRSEEPDGTYKKIGTADHDRSFRDDFQNNPELQGKILYYKINTWFYPYELSFAEGNAVASTGGGGGNSTVDYTAVDLGQFATSISGNIHLLKEKVIDNSIYLGLIKEANAAAIGTPALYKYDGSSWQEQWTTTPDIEFRDIHFAVEGSNSYLGGINNSLFLYKWDGAVWTENLAGDNLGQAEGPSDCDIEVYNDELYMAITQYPDYDLQVLKQNGSAWDTIGGDVNGLIASGDIFDVEIENIDATLYLHYRIDDAFYIQHFNGSSWITDLQWTQEWLGTVDLVKKASELYFSADTRSVNYNGGVYHVTSSTTTENLIPEDSEWFKLGAFTLAIDSDSDIVVSSMKIVSADEIYPYLNIFDGTEWKTISGDFSDGSRPVGISTIGTDIYYVYGDATSEDALGFPTRIKSKKMSK